jgi:nucleotidyltransferase AbiEii toxin of type IV toxin-antitoxin system
MTGSKVKNAATSVHDRLLNRAKKENRPFNEVLQYYANENKLDLVKGIVKDICETAVEDDGLIFITGSITTDHIMEDSAYRGIRVRLTANLEKARIIMQLDIGFGDGIVPKPEEVSYPSLLNFPSFALQMYSRESAIAEKFETMVKLGELNSRMRDFYDIWEFSSSFEFSGSVLAEAIHTTFRNRGTELPEMPIAFTSDFYESNETQTKWNTFLRKTRLSGIPDFSQVCRDIREFLSPIISAIRNSKRFEKYWNHKSKWK